MQHFTVVSTNYTTLTDGYMNKYSFVGTVLLGVIIIGLF